MPNAISANNFLVAGVPGLTPLISAGRTAHLHSPGQLDWMQRRTKLLPPSEGSRDLGSACCRRTDETMGRGDLVTQLAELAIQNTASKIGSSALYGCPSLPNSPIVQWEEAKTEYARDQSDVTKFKTVIYVWSLTYSHRSKTWPRGPAPRPSPDDRGMIYFCKEISYKLENVKKKTFDN